MATLKNLVDETTNIKNELKECYSNLKNNLVEKGVECSDSDKMSSLIDKVNELGDVPLYLYKEGDECVDATGGIEVVKANSATSGVARKDENKIYLDSGTTGTYTPREKTVYATTFKKIDLSGYSKLNIKLSNVYKSSSSSIILRVKDTKPTSNSTSHDSGIASMNLNNGICTLAIGNINTSAYVYVDVYASYSSTQYRAYCDIEQIWLEK